MTNEDPYTYPGTNVLINTFGIRDPSELAKVELRYLSNRLDEGAPLGNFDLLHLQKIHHHLFQDVYPWAGEIRTVQLEKQSWFLPAENIEMGVADIHRRLAGADFLHETTSAEFAAQSASIMADINHSHPFRDGNGRTQLLYFKQLAEQAGHPVDLSLFNREQWIAASIQSHDQEPVLMREAITSALQDPDSTINVEPSVLGEEQIQDV